MNQEQTIRKLLALCDLYGIPSDETREFRKGLDMKEDLSGVIAIHERRFGKGSWEALEKRVRARNPWICSIIDETESNFARLESSQWEMFKYQLRTNWDSFVAGAIIAVVIALIVF